MTNNKLSAILTFMDGIRKNPRHTGAIFPSGPVLAREMASLIDPKAEGYVLELGPGTGVVTEAILARGVPPEKLVLIEYNADFCKFLRTRFPGVKVIEDSAFELGRVCREHGIDRISGVISGIPLLNFPMDLRANLVQSCLDMMPPGGKYIQFTYGAKPSVPAEMIDGEVTSGKRVWRNFPPATLWVYQRETVAVREAAVA